MDPIKSEDPRDRRIRELEGLLEKALKRITELEAEVANLRQQLAQNSRNSSRPPSSDGLKKPDAKPKPKSSRKKGRRQSGGQPGHRGETLKRSEHVDHVVRLEAPARCPCGESLQDVRSDVVDSRQVHDIPPIPAIEVTEYRLESKTCPCCQAVAQGTFPEDVKAPVSYGPRLQAVLIYCRTYQLIPIARTCELMADFFGVSVSEGTVVNTVATMDEKVAPSVASIAEELKQASILHSDETGIRIEGKRRWLHVASNATLTHYDVHDKRGNAAMDDIGILPEFSGRLIHDHWQPYFCYGDCSHGLCNVHHLRDLVFLHEELDQHWAAQMHRCLLDMKRAVDGAKAQGQERLPGGTMEALLRRYQSIVAYGEIEAPPPEPSPVRKRGKPKKGKSRMLLERFRDRRQEILAFMFDFSVPFGNNQGEQDIRMTKIQQKISGTFRSWAGAKQFCRIRSYLSSARKQGHQVMQVLLGALRGQPFMPCPA